MAKVKEEELLKAKEEQEKLLDSIKKKKEKEAKEAKERLET